MGIRVHKVMGYGLTDLEATDRKITDPRISADALLGGADMPNGAEYLAWLEREDELGDDLSRALDRFTVEERLKEGKTVDLWNSVAHDGEFGLPNVIVFTPPSMPDWRRYDDPIDWVEETYPLGDQEAQANDARQFPHGFYPYSGSYMDTRTGEDLDQNIMYWVRGVSANADEQELDGLAQVAGFATHREAAAYVAPIVPDDVRRLVKFLKVFNSPDGWRELRPTLYTYWS